MLNCVHVAYARQCVCASNSQLLNYLLAFRPLLSKAVNRLSQIYNNKLKVSRLFFALTLLCPWCILRHA